MNDPGEDCSNTSSSSHQQQQLHQRRSCTDLCSHGTNSTCSYCSQQTNSSASGSERDMDSSSCVCIASGSMPDSPVIVEVTGSIDCHQQQQQQQPQSATANVPLFFGARKRSHSSNCNVLSSDPEPVDHDRDHDHESSFEWWFHRRKSSHKSRYWLRQRSATYAPLFVVAFPSCVHLVVNCFLGLPCVQ